VPDKAIYVLLVDGFADWEPAHALAELRRHGKYRVESVGLTTAPVESMGGMRVVPSTTIDAVDANGDAALPSALGCHVYTAGILPGNWRA